MPIIFGVKRRPIHSFHANSYVREIKTFANWNISPKCMFCGNNRTIIISINMIYKSNRDKMQRVCYSNRSKCLTHQKTARRVRLIESFHTVISILPPHIHTHKISQCMRTHWFLVENQCRKTNANADPAYITTLNETWIVCHSTKQRNMIELACAYDWFEMKAWPIQCQIGERRGALALITHDILFSIGSKFCIFLWTLLFSNLSMHMVQKIENPAETH